MEYLDEIFVSDKTRSNGSNDHWQNTIDLLKYVQNDYRGARRQLEQVSLHLSESEALVSQRLQYAFLASHGYRTLCLVEYAVNNSINRLGDTVLGGFARPEKIPLPARIEVRCLGRFEVRSSLGQIDHWHSVKARSAFQFLLIKPREPTIKEALMEALWPECSPQAAGNNLKSAIHSLRSTLGGLVEQQKSLQYIHFLQGSYVINPEVNLWVDVEEFEKSQAAGRRLMKEGKKVEAVREFEKAEALYRGDFLEDEPYEDWTLLRREALKDSYLIILSKLADYYLDTRDYESCIHYSQKILAEDHCREDSYRRLMHCYSRLGQKNRALRWYQICCQTTKNELDAMPDSETTRLFDKILKDAEI